MSSFFQTRYAKLVDSFHRTPVQGEAMTSFFQTRYAKLVDSPNQRAPWWHSLPLPDGNRISGFHQDKDMQFKMWKALQIPNVGGLAGKRVLDVGARMASSRWQLTSPGLSKLPPSAPRTTTPGRTTSSMLARSGGLAPSSSLRIFELTISDISMILFFSLVSCTTWRTSSTA